MKLIVLFLIGMIIFITPVVGQEFESFLKPSVKIMGMVDDTSLDISSVLREVNNLAGFTSVTKKVSEQSIFKLSEIGTTTRGMENATDLYSATVRAVVILISPDASSLGAGCIISESGDIITNWHVVRDQKEMYAFFYSEGVSELTSLKGKDATLCKIIGMDPSRDLALLRLPRVKKYIAMKLANGNTVKVAQDVFAIGHPESLLWSFTYGVISQLRKNYEWGTADGLKFKANVIQTQTPINPGNSGGPLLNKDGKLIGINSFRSQGAEGLNFAVNVNEIQSFQEGVAGGSYNPLKMSALSTRVIHWEAIDTDGDGVKDGERADLLGTGKYNAIRFDKNHDGKIDELWLDTNGDGKIDVIVQDRDGDGRLEYFQIDTDYDGKIDLIGIDQDGDGIPDKFYKP